MWSLLVSGRWHRAPFTARAAVVPHEFWPVNGSLFQSRVLFEASLVVGVAILLASTDPLFKMEWTLCPNLTGLEVPIAVAGVPHLGEPHKPVLKAPA